MKHPVATLHTGRGIAACARWLGILLLVSSTAGCTSERSEPPGARSATPSATTTSATPSSGLGRPKSIAALGDSMTRAFASCPGAGDCPRNSWSTGSTPEVFSHAQRIATLSGHEPEVHNLAVSGATVAALSTQAQAVPADVHYVTVLIGANDACASSEAAMTPVGEFETLFRAAMAALVDRVPDARLLVVSIPDLHRLWEVGKDDDVVVTTWEQFGICQSMLARPHADDRSADARRARVRQRMSDYNRVMSAVCREHAQCRDDGGAVFDFDFSIEMVSEADFWHPSVAGQRALSEVAWRAGYADALVVGR